jgi:hypothetical protein
MGKTETIPSKLRNETWVPPSQLVFNTVLEFLARATRQEEEMKGIQIGKKKKKYSQNIPIGRQHDPIPQRPKNSMQKLLDTIRIFSNVVGYKINLQKPLDFLHTNNKQTEK